MNNNELYHYGVPGMRWGVRKKTRNMSADAKEAKNLKKKRIDEMSNDELGKLNRRQQLEQQHKQLNPSKIAKGLLIAGAVAAALGTINKLYKSSKESAKIGKEVAGQYKATKLKKKHAAQIQKVGKGIAYKYKDLKVSTKFTQPSTLNAKTVLTLNRR